YLFGTDDDGDPDPSDLGVGTDASVEAMERIAELGEKGEGVLKRSIDADNAPSLFEGGDVPYYVTGPWALAGAEDAGIDYAVSPVPGFEGAEQAAPFLGVQAFFVAAEEGRGDRKSTRLNSSHVKISYAVFCLKKKTEM